MAAVAAPMVCSPTRNCDAAHTPPARGNPAMLRHLLLGRRREGKLTFDSQSGRWRWDEASPMTSAGSADNVAAALAARLQRLPAGVQRVLAIAALADPPSHLTSLRAVGRRVPLETTHAPREALPDGLPVPPDTELHHPQPAPPGTD